jgi:soluble lytic murein transglycosylase
MLSDAIERLMRSDLDAAFHHWQQLADHFRWDDDQRMAIPRRIALLRATDYPADALTSLRALPESAVDQQIREWRVRVALHASNWRAALDELDAFSAADQQRDRWRYWRARALAETGRAPEAEALFSTLATEPNFYGFLAAERLGQPYALCPKLRDAQVDILAELGAIPAFARAIELFHADQLNYARREWSRALADQPPEVRRHAAVLADAEGWHERAILTLADAGFLTQYAMRFPLAYADRVGRESARQRLNPSLVYGVMRSESAMAPDAISGANARGLMQLTPATGRQVARAERLPLPRSSELLEPDRNIRLGSAYLDQLFDRFNHPLLVLAAYNAGPEPVERWQDAGMPIEADRWIETVPYHETRDYLSRVLAFATIYDWRRLGRMVPISVRMPPMDATPGKSDLNARPAIQPACPAQKEQVSP